MSRKVNDPPHAFDDHLPLREVGSWAKTKYELVSLYATLFSSGMKTKWAKRVYVELYSGCGYNKIQRSASIIAGSPLRALALQHPFDKYVFCEENKEFLDALKVRAKRLAPKADIKYVQGDCNQQIDDIISEIPLGSKKRGRAFAMFC